MNIEHQFFEATGKYESFEGICLVDTFELAEAKQISFFTTENTARVERQRRAPIRLVIGNPPYNANQINENDNNKNRRYKSMEARVAETYVKASSARLKSKYRDPYIKAIRWASDRIGEEGIVAFVTNNSFAGDSSFDGIRKHLEKDFAKIYHIDLKGNARTSGERRRQEAGNVFDDMIRVGVGITFFIRKAVTADCAELWKYSIDDYLKTAAKKDFLITNQTVFNIPLRRLTTDARHSWLSQELETAFTTFLPLGVKEKGSEAAESIFQLYSLGVSTNRDSAVYGFNEKALEARVRSTAENYNAEVDRWKRAGSPKHIDDFVNYEKVKWSEHLKAELKRSRLVMFDRAKIRSALYRPFLKKVLYYDSILNDRPAHFASIFPNSEAENTNRLISVNAFANKKPFFCLQTNAIADLHLTGDSQCFPFYTFNDDRTNRRENITDWALEQFRSHYKVKSITKWDIFHYVYAVLHHPLYLERYAANLKRELPRIPFAPEFKMFADIGNRLAEIHVNYEQQPEYPLERIETPGKPLDWRVEKMKLSKDKRSLIYNDFLTLSGIPLEVFDYRLGNRSALEWIIDQYQVSTDKRSGITNDPNRDDDPQYIVRLIGQVVTVSLETAKLVNSLRALELVSAP